MLEIAYRWDRTSAPARLQPGAAGRETRLYVHDAKPSVGDLRARRHHPDEIDGMPGRRHIRVVARRHDHGVSVADDLGKLVLGCAAVDELDAERGGWHVEVHVRLLEDRGVLMRRPARPV